MFLLLKIFLIENKVIFNYQILMQMGVTYEEYNLWQTNNDHYELKKCAKINFLRVKVSWFV